jgi:hypothetical protein
MRLGCVLIALGVLVGGCQKKSDELKAALPPSPKLAKLPEPSHNAEVEISGDWKNGGLPSASVELVAQKEPCLPVPANPTRLGTQKLSAEGTLFAEFYIPQGTAGAICLYAKDASGAVVAAASYEKNPVTFEGTGEVEIGPLHLVLAKLQ